MKHRILTLIAALSLALALAAQAQALPRTFVSASGSDAADCSLATPCRTFAGALPNTDARGEIIALDSGTYGVVAINKAVTIQGAPGVFAALGNSSGTIPVVINAGVTDVVVLRNLQVSQGGHTLRGIMFNTGGALYIEGCVVTGFSGYAIAFIPPGCNENGCPKLFIKDTITRNNGTGLYVSSVVASIDHCRIENNTTGVKIDTQASVTIRDTVVAGNTGVGLSAVNGLASMRVENCIVTNNGTGLQAAGSQFYQTSIHVSNTMIMANQTGLLTSGGQIISFGNNRLASNGTNGAFTGTIQQQ